MGFFFLSFSLYFFLWQKRKTERERKKNVIFFVQVYVHETRQDNFFIANKQSIFFLMVVQLKKMIRLVQVDNLYVFGLWKNNSLNKGFLW